MNHCILVKFRPGFDTDAALPDIRRIFGSIRLPGVRGVRYLRNCVDRENRYHLAIVIDMDRGSLAAYDASAGHLEWKNKYSQYIESKAIFDYENYDREVNV